MKRILACFLMLLTVLPGVVCAMPGGAFDLDSSGPGEKPHCDDSATPVTPHTQNASEIMLYVDCMGVDLSPAQSIVKMPEPALALDLDWDGGFAVTLYGADHLFRLNPIRGSPVLTGPVLSQSSIYLSTRRIRI